ncbi:hypothetical protein J7L68_04855 [bacterium]|nr:hypothetical protein [bacterium]
MRYRTFLIIAFVALTTILSAEPLLLMLTDGSGTVVDDYVVSDGSSEITIPTNWWDTGSAIGIYSLPDTILVATLSLDDLEHCGYADQSGWAHIAATAIRTLGTTWADSSDTANFAWHADTADTAILADHSRWADSTAHADSTDNSAFAWVADSAYRADTARIAGYSDTANFALFADSGRVVATAWNLQPGDADYIWNQASVSQPADFWITGSGWIMDSLRVDNNVNIGGKLTVAGGIDPTYLALTPQTISPGIDHAIWIRESDSVLIYNDGTADIEVMTNTDTIFASIYSDSAIYADTAVFSYYSDTAGTSFAAHLADSATQSIYADTALFIARAETASYADSALFTIKSDSSIYADTAIFSYYSDTAGTSFAAHLADSATQSIYADTALFIARAETASYADSAIYADTAGYALDLASGDADYIQNQNAGAQVGADFWIDGAGVIDDSLLVNGNAYIDGKLTVTGAIDPTYIVLTPQGASPSIANAIWIDIATGEIIYNDGTGDSPIVTQNDTAVYCDSAVYADSTGAILWNDILTVPTTIMMEGENVSLLANDAGYLTSLDFDTLGAYWDTTNHFSNFSQDSIDWDTLQAYSDTTITNTIYDSLGAYADTTVTNAIYDSLGAYWDTTNHFSNFSQDSIDWDTLQAYSDTTITNAIYDSLGAYADTTVTNAIYDSLGAYWDTTNHFSNFSQDSIDWDTLQTYSDTTVTDAIRDSMAIVVNDTSAVLRILIGTKTDTLDFNKIVDDTTKWNGYETTLGLITDDTTNFHTAYTKSLTFIDSAAIHDSLDAVRGETVDGIGNASGMSTVDTNIIAGVSSGSHIVVTANFGGTWTIPLSCVCTTGTLFVKCGEADTASFRANGYFYYGTK